MASFSVAGFERNEPILERNAILVVKQHVVQVLIMQSGFTGFRNGPTRSAYDNVTFYDGVVVCDLSRCVSCADDNAFQIIDKYVADDAFISSRMPTLNSVSRIDNDIISDYPERHCLMDAYCGMVGETAMMGCYVADHISDEVNMLNTEVIITATAIKRAASI